MLLLTLFQVWDSKTFAKKERKSLYNGMMPAFISRRQNFNKYLYRCQLEEDKLLLHLQDTRNLRSNRSTFSEIFT